MTNNGAEKFTEAEELAIEAALKKRLGPNYLSTRPGSYIPCLSYTVRGPYQLGLYFIWS